MDAKKDSKLVVEEKLEEKLKRFRFAFDPACVLEGAEKELEGKKKGFRVEPESNTYKALTLSEFENGMLMSTVMDEPYKTFALNLSRDLQKEFDCKTPSEKATAELATMCYVRALDVQKRLNNFLGKDSYGDLTIKIISVLSKELDRVNRQYLGAIQTLRMLRQPLMQLNIKANTAVVGQNQMVQANKYE